jgi:hypothetical protein
MTWMLMGATFALLTVLGVSCRRAQLDLREQLCECLQAPVAAAVGFGADAVEIVPAGPVLVPIDGGREAAACGSSGPSRRRHLHVVGAG